MEFFQRFFICSPYPDGAQITGKIPLISAAGEDEYLYPGIAVRLPLSFNHCSINFYWTADISLKSI
jgi:hypothetical protein